MKQIRKGIKSTNVLSFRTPMLTLREDKMASRVGASILEAVGLSELICTSYSIYEVICSEDLTIALSLFVFDVK